MHDIMFQNGRYRQNAKYRDWWVGKCCRVKFSNSNFKPVKDVKFNSPPSGVRGDVTILYYDGTQDVIKGDYPIYRARKKDVEVKDE